MKGGFLFCYFSYFAASVLLSQLKPRAKANKSREAKYSNTATQLKAGNLERHARGTFQRGAGLPISADPPAVPSGSVSGSSSGLWDNAACAAWLKVHLKKARLKSSRLYARVLLPITPAYLTCISSTWLVSKKLLRAGHVVRMPRNKS